MLPTGETETEITLNLSDPPIPPTDASFDQYPLHRLTGGAHSEAFRFETPAGPRVLRHNLETDYGYGKDAYAATTFASDELPIPPVLEIGQEPGGGFYAVSELVPGVVFNQLEENEAVALTPVIATLLDNLGSIQPKAAGYGWWEPDGHGKHASWRETMMALRDLPNDPDLSTVRFFDTEFHKQVASVVDRLLGFCPEERKLVHGDIRGNILVDAGQATGVIDWSHSMYGDPLYDIALLEDAFPNRKDKETFREHLGPQIRLSQHYDQRVLCYQLLRATSDLCYFARELNDERRYERNKQKLLDTIQRSGVNTAN